MIHHCDNCMQLIDTSDLSGDQTHFITKDDWGDTIAFCCKPCAKEYMDNLKAEQE